MEIFCDSLFVNVMIKMSRYIAESCQELQEAEDDVSAALIRST